MFRVLLLHCFQCLNKFEIRKQVPQQEQQQQQQQQQQQLQQQSGVSYRAATKVAAKKLTYLS